MSNQEKINEIASEITKFRNSSQKVVDDSLVLMTKLVAELATIKLDDSTRSLYTKEVQQFNDDLFSKLTHNMQSCLDSINKYNESLNGDYAKALSKLSQLKEGN